MNNKNNDVQHLFEPSTNKNSESDLEKQFLNLSGTSILLFDLAINTICVKVLNNIKTDIAFTCHDFKDMIMKKHILTNSDMNRITTSINKIRSTDASIRTETVKFSHADGKMLWFNIKTIRIDIKETLLIYIDPIDDKLNLDEALKQRAEMDSLTGLFNRETFFEKAAERIAKKEAGYWVISSLDVDNFKVINDRYGTQKGDEVLRYIGNLFFKSFLGSGGIVSRILSDNFAFIYPASMKKTGELDKIRTMASRPPCIDQLINFRIGRYTVNDLNISVDSMYDRALLAQESIRNRYNVNIAEYSEVMREQLLREQEIVDEMDIALARNQFELWFQPQFNQIKNTLIGAEVLVRWRHPTKGLLIPPGDFIPVFERNGFVYEMDKYVWEHACKFIKNQIDKGETPLPLSVNVSRYDILRDDIYDIITGYVRKYDVPIDLLRLEITESAFAENSEGVIIATKRFIDDGFIVEIDDFGSGYSSLNTLKDVPANILKLDMHFLDNRSDSVRGGTILESVVRMAKWLGMPVIAEGVETKEQADFLKSIGCAYVQGYLYARPMPQNEYEHISENYDKQLDINALETTGTFESEKFWNPASIETLIFNSYVGGACIIELFNDKFEILRANDKLPEVIAPGIGLSVEELLSYDFTKYISKESSNTLQKELLKAINEDKEVNSEVVFHGLPKCPEEICLSVTMRIIARADKRYMIYCLALNITAQKEAQEMNKRSSERMHTILNAVSSGIVATKCIEGKANYIFANKAFFSMLGYTNNEYEITEGDPLVFINSDDYKYVKEKIKSVTKENESVSFEFRATRRDNKEIWLKGTTSVTHLFDEDVPVHLNVLEDITRQRKNEQTTKSVDKQLHFLNEIAKELLIDDEHEALSAAIEKVRSYFGARCAYICEFDIIHDTALVTYEALSKNAVSKKDSFKNIPLSYIKEHFKRLDDENYIYLNDIISSPEDKALQKSCPIFDEGGHINAFAIKRQDNIIGYVVLDDPTKRNIYLNNLRALCGYISIILSRRDILSFFKLNRKNLYEAINGIPCGFLRLSLKNNDISDALFYNDGFCEMTKTSREDAANEYNVSTNWGIHPDDINEFRSCLKKTIKNGEREKCICRLKKVSGDYLQVEASAKKSTDENEEEYLNVYFSDISEQLSIQEQRIQLIENLPCGAGIYEISDKGIKLNYLNKRYKQIVGRNVEDIPSEVDVLAPIHPEDRQSVLDELYSAIDEKRDFTCNIRLKNDEGIYHEFVLNANMEKRISDVRIIYATFTPVSEKELSYRDMLKSSLSTIMEAFDDLLYIKDTNLRYISLSEAMAKYYGLKSASDMIGKTDSELFEGKLCPTYVKYDLEVMHSAKASLNKIERINDRNGDVRYINMSRYPMRDYHHNIIGVYCCGWDITKYHENHDRLKLLSDTLRGGLISCECTNDSIKILYSSEGIAVLYGYSAFDNAKIVGKEPMRLVFKEDRQLIREKVDRLIAGEVSIDCTYRIQTIDGIVKWLEVKGVCSQRYSDRIIVNAAIFDVTDSMLAKDALKVSEDELKIAITKMGQMIGEYNLLTHTLTLPIEYAKKIQPSLYYQ